ncbi:nitroreductase family deazaflavin-dependent oxidoreductase [Mycolicibacterium hodleri]|uniref:Nitroreductase family deazaflavin-dependent oxidoreductase n=1 Tax=Mycolicibacterium hodleri TaxID=49897 RepID=A0A502EEM3_9MYCO|nr:nitroreductase family deazaflavin-dependent oxidoreductase [Mycolicibacterium hodleri]TPG34946.1 nitroreductase family deazaflavin-dependent oxidoreductase [Mycolicibacterium hodleri]
MGIPRVDPTAGSPLLRIGARLTGNTPGRWLTRRVAPRLDRQLLRLSRGRVSSAVVTPELLLFHTGSRTGRPRSTPLTYFTDGDRVIVVASNYGGSRHPAWYYNVLAQPRVTIAAGGYRGTFIGQEMTGVERDRLWNLAVTFIPSYAQYERLAGDRMIPVLAFTETD